MLAVRPCSLFIRLFPLCLDPQCAVHHTGDSCTVPAQGPSAAFKHRALPQPEQCSSVNGQLAVPIKSQVNGLLQVIPNAVYVGEVIAGGYTSVREVMVHFFW